MTIAQAAEALGLQPGTLRRQVRLGKLRAERVGSVYLITPAALEAYKRASWGQKKGGPKQKRGRKP